MRHRHFLRKYIWIVVVVVVVVVSVVVVLVVVVIDCVRSREIIDRVVSIHPFGCLKCSPALNHLTKDLDIWCIFGD